MTLCPFYISYIFLKLLPVKAGYGIAMSLCPCIHASACGSNVISTFEVVFSHFISYTHIIHTLIHSISFALSHSLSHIHYHSHGNSHSINLLPTLLLALLFFFHRTQAQLMLVEFALIVCVSALWRFEWEFLLTMFTVVNHVGYCWILFWSVFKIETILFRGDVKKNNANFLVVHTP